MTNSSIAFQMFRTGMGVPEIAKEINVSKSTVYKYIDLEMDRFNERDIPNSGPPRRYNKKDLEFSVRSGATLEQIAKKYNVSNKTIKRWLKECEIYFENVSEIKCINSDRHLCKTCRFRMKDKLMKSHGARCNYIGVTGESRKCDACICDKYVLEKTKKRKRKNRNLGGQNGGNNKEL